MLGIYFSGTGNSRYCVEVFTRELPGEINALSIEDESTVVEIQNNNELVIGYPVQYSNVPKILKDFIVSNKGVWAEKKIFIIATMGLFSGDGTGMLARLLKSYGAVITGGVHIKMPDSICDEKLLKRPLEVNRELVVSAELKIKKTVLSMKKGNPPQEGLGNISRLIGLFGQRLYFYNKTRDYSDKLKIDESKCIGCGECVRLCPMKNIRLDSGKAASGNHCTMCYRCVNKCPVQAMTLLGKKVIEQGYVDKYL